MLYRYNHKKKVIVLGHSMGNPVMNYFYHNYVDQVYYCKISLIIILGMERYICRNSYIFGWGMGRCYANSRFICIRLFFKYLLNIFLGYNMNFYRIILSPITLRGMQRTFTSSAFLFPSFKLWKCDEVLGITALKNYTLNNIKEFFDDIDWPIGYLQYLGMKDSLILDAPGVKVNFSMILFFKFRLNVFTEKE